MNPLPSDPLGLSDPLRNPERLTAEQIGEGYQCLTAEQRAAKVPCEYWSTVRKMWIPFGPLTYLGGWDDWTLRCPISQPLPATGTNPQPESEVKPCSTIAADTDGPARELPVRIAPPATIETSNSPVAVQSGDSGELKPCPFCGNATTGIGNVTNTGGRTLFRGCTECNAKGPWSESQELDALWNTRAESTELAQLRAENAELKADREPCDAQEMGSRTLCECRVCRSFQSLNKENASLRSQLAAGHIPKDHVIDRGLPIEAQLKQAETWLDQLHHSYVEIQKTCAAKDAALIEARSQLAELEKDKKPLIAFCESALRQFDRLKKTGQLNHGTALLAVQSYDVEPLRSAIDARQPPQAKGPQCAPTGAPEE